MLFFIVFVFLLCFEGNVWCFFFIVFVFLLCFEGNVWCFFHSFCVPFVF